MARYRLSARITARFSSMVRNPFYMRTNQWLFQAKNWVKMISRRYQTVFLVWEIAYLLCGHAAFVQGGPANGKLVEPKLMLAGSDRVAIDAVGVAALRHFGTTRAVRRGPIFEQEQIARAVELGLGVGTPEEIELVTANPESAAYAEEIREMLLAG